MKATQYIADSSVAFTTGAVANSATGQPSNDLLVGILALLAPIVKDVFGALIDRLIAKRKARKNEDSKGL